jgi:hypothetical protein
MFCWPCISIYACNETNLMHYLSSVYSVTIPLHVSGLLVVHHQEVTLYICSNWYVMYVLVDCRSSILLHDVSWFVDVLGQQIGTIFKDQDVQERIFTLESWNATLSRKSITSLWRATTQNSDVLHTPQMCHSLKISTIYSLTAMSKRRLHVTDSGFSKMKNLKKIVIFN